MSNFKKVVIGMGLLGALATSGFSEELKLDQNICIKHKVINDNYYNNNGYCNVPFITNDENFGSFIKENKNIYINMNEFICFMKSNNKNGTEEIRKFTIANLVEGKMEKNDKDLLTLKKTIIKIYSIDDLSSSYYSGKNGAFNLTYFFVGDNLSKSKETSVSFMKYILNKDYKGAEAYIKDINEKSGVNKVFNEIESECKEIK